jgi:uncharacterized protein (DUF952 family)
MAIIYHITSASNWAAARRQGSYAADTLASQGFIHCSKPSQIITVANRYYAGQRGLVLLAIAPAQVEAEIRFENLEGGSELFPHIYGPLNLDAVTMVLPFEPGSDGAFSLPDYAPAG